MSWSADRALFGANGESLDEGPDEKGQRLEAVICEYIKACESGAKPDPSEWLARHPEFERELAEYFDTADRLQGLVAASEPLDLGAEARFGPFRLVRQIGQGGMGTVYEVREASSTRRLALKLLEVRDLTGGTEKERFRNEAAALRRLDHPNIVPILGFHEIGRFSGIAMPLIEGSDLRAIRRALQSTARARAELVSAADSRSGATDPFLVAHPDRPADRFSLRETPARWRAIALVGLQAARALAHAHERGILHRDVKPSNLLLDVEGRILLTDFGLADQTRLGAADLTLTGDVVGTLRYVAPERLHDWRDPRSDLYSLGLTLYYPGM